MNVTKDDLREAVALLSERQADFREEVRISFADVKERQDRTNGRIDKGEERLVEHSRLLYDHGQTMAGIVATMKSFALPTSMVMKADDQKPGVTQRDIKVAAVMFGIGGALIEYGPKVLKALAAMGAQP